MNIVCVPPSYSTVPAASSNVPKLLTVPASSNLLPLFKSIVAPLASKVPPTSTVCEALIIRLFPLLTVKFPRLFVEASTVTSCLTTVFSLAGGTPFPPHVEVLLQFPS